MNCLLIVIFIKFNPEDNSEHSESYGHKKLKRFKFAYIFPLQRKRIINKGLSSIKIC